MNTQPSQNVQSPAGWTGQTYVDAANNVQVGHSLSPIWPFSVYPPLPPGHPATLPPGLAYGVPSQATIMGPARHSLKSSPPQPTNQSLASNAAGLVPVHPPSTSSSHTSLASWSQPYVGSVYLPPSLPQWSNLYAGYYYLYNAQGQGSIYPPAVSQRPFAANYPPAAISSRAYDETGNLPRPKGHTCCDQQPSDIGGLPATYEFTFKCYPELQQCCSAQPSQDLQVLFKDILPDDSAEVAPCFLSSQPAQATNELPFGDLAAFQGLLDGLMNQEEPSLPSTFACEADPVYDDEAAAQLICSILTGQGSAADDNAYGSLELQPSPSPAPSTSSSQTQLSGSTLVSPWSASGSSSKAESPLPLYAVSSQQGMFFANPPAQFTSVQQGRKRAMDSEPESSAPTPKSRPSKRRRVAGGTRAARKYWCTKCSEYVAAHRRKIHEDSRRHTGKGLFTCRICIVLGIFNYGHSRKDSLKRHIIQQHGHQFGPIWESNPSLLKPYIEGEDLRYLKCAMKASQPRQ